MKHSLILATALTIGVAAPSVADAQYRRESVVVTLKVDSWTPHEGAAGTLVTLNGVGFTRRTSVLVGGRVVRPTKMGARAISFRMPSYVGDGRIILRKSGVANDYVVGNFNVWTNPKVVAFGPVSGTYGTRVEIRGQNFSQDDQVMLGQQPLRIDSWTETGLVVTIPNGAASGYFTVRNARNSESRSRQQFRVVQPAPYISDFAPLGGEPGSTVRIRGGNYGNDISVNYGRQPMPITRTGNGWIEVSIPAGARRSEAINIRSRRGNVSSVGNYALALPPALGSYSPAWGTVGTQVTLSGQNFTANDRVSLGGVNCRIIQLTGNRITVEVPNNAASGAFAIHRGAQAVQAASRFEVAYAPVIAGFSAMAGAPGTRITMTGQHLDGARLYLNNQEIRPISASPGQVQFAIPARARSGNFRIAGRAGQSNWAKPFEVWNYPQIRRISSARGPVGSTLALTGTMLSNASQIFLGDVELPRLPGSNANQVLVRIPQGARSGNISWTAYGKNTRSNWNYDVLRAPVLTSYSPTEGAAGTMVTLSGEGFDRGTRVRYGNTPVRVVRWEPGRLTIQIPQGARNSDYISVDGVGGNYQARTPFGLLVAPAVGSWYPRTAKPNTELTLNGNGLAMDTLVQIGGQPARVIRAGRDGRSVVVAVPALNAGSYDVSVQTKGLRSVARKRFQVDGWAQINAVLPGHARIGDTIMLSGQGLATARIFYGNVELPVARTDRRGRRLWVTIPQGCSGKSLLSVMDGQHRAPSSNWLQIDAPKPPTVRDHRNKGNDKYQRPTRRGPKVRDHRRRR